MFLYEDRHTVSFKELIISFLKRVLSFCQTCSGKHGLPYLCPESFSSSSNLLREKTVDLLLSTCSDPA